MKICVIGLGYVGLPLALAASKVGINVTGIDIDIDKITKIQNGNSATEDISNKEVVEALTSSKFSASSSFKAVSDSDVVVICVPTPLNEHHQPELKYLLSATTSVLEYFNPDKLLVVESTVAPGTIRETVLPLFESKFKLSSDRFHLAYSPERIDPLNQFWKIENTPKLVAGTSEVAADMAFNFYSKFITRVQKVSSLEVAETAKLLENSFRLVNISFINEMSMLCEKLKIDINEVIAAASTKPYGFMPFYPSIGVGGHCIPIDPIYLSEKARQLGVPLQMIDLASNINLQMSKYFVSRAESRIGNLKDKKILIIGVSYKSNISDVRETPVESLIAGLELKGAKVSWHDNLVKVWKGESSTSLSENFDLAILATPHDYLNLLDLGEVPILNTRSSL